MAGPIRNLIQSIRQNRQMRRQERGEGLPLLRGRGGLPLFHSLGAGTSRLDAQVASRIAARSPADRRMQANADGPDVGKYAGNRPDGIVFPTETTTNGPKPESIRTPSPKQPAGTRALPVSNVPDPDRTSGMAGPKAVTSGAQDLPEPPPKMTPRQSLMSQREQAQRHLTETRSLMARGGYTPEQLLGLQSSAAVASQQIGDFTDQLSALDESENPAATVAIRSVQDMARQAVRGEATWEGVDRLAAGQFAVQTDAGVTMPDPEAARRVARPIVEEHARGLFDQYDGFKNIPADQRSHLLRGLIYAYPINPKSVADPKLLDGERSRIAMQLNSVMNQQNDPRRAAYYSALAEYIVLQQKMAMGGVR